MIIDTPTRILMLALTPFFIFLFCPFPRSTVIPIMTTDHIPARALHCTYNAAGLCLFAQDAGRVGDSSLFLGIDRSFLFVLKEQESPRWVWRLAWRDKGEARRLRLKGSAPEVPESGRVVPPLHLTIGPRVVRAARSSSNQQAERIAGPRPSIKP